MMTVVSMLLVGTRVMPGARVPDDARLLPIVEQVGVLRTNCIDCLDRTNVAQFALGLVALGQQFQALGVTEHADIDVESTMSVELGHM